MKTTEYVCKNCESEFSVPGVIFERLGTKNPTAYKEIAVCPICGCDGFEEKRSKTPTKTELKQYIDLVRELELEQRKLRRLKKNSESYNELSELIENHSMRCHAELMKLQSYIYTIEDSFTRQVFTLRYIYGLSWQKVAMEAGPFYTSDQLRIMHDRYLKK